MLMFEVSGHNCSEKRREEVEGKQKPFNPRQSVQLCACVTQNYYIHFISLAIMQTAAIKHVFIENCELKRATI